MPQLDKVTFYSQIFWLIVVFFSLHYVFLKLILPTIAASLKYRNYVLSSYTNSQNMFSSEKLKLDELQKQVFLTPLAKFSNYLSVVDSSTNSLLFSTSVSFQKFLYNNLSNSVFKDSWSLFVLRNDLKNLD